MGDRTGVYVCVHRSGYVCQQLLQSTKLPDHMHAMLMGTSGMCTNVANASLVDAEHSWHEQGVDVAALTCLA